MADISEILTFRHLRRIVPRLEVLLFTREKPLSLKQTDLGHVQRVLKCPYIDRCGIS
jgi:hypothetical protein